MKYISKEVWEQYLLSHLEVVKEDIKDIPSNPNKGIQFEVLIECLLKYKYSEDDLSFQKTKLSHDGNKDFWAIDNTNKLWWAECKNYTPNISLTQLAPTLVMAEINQVSHLMFFSYSSLNANLKKRVAQYAYKYHKEVFLFDDDALEQLIFLYGKQELYDKFHLKSTIFEETLQTHFFNELNPSVAGYHLFDGNYDIKELNVGCIYDLNVILINRFNTNVQVKVSIKDDEFNQYFDFLNSNLNRVSELPNEILILQPNQLVLVKYSVRAKKENSHIQLPKIEIIFEKDGSTCTKISDQCNNYICNWNKKVVLIGEYYEKIIQNFSIMCKKKVCALLVHGPSGTGKTRILEECETFLIKNQYNIINFIGFDKVASWKEVVLEIAYQVFGIEESLTSVIACELDEIVTPNMSDSVKLKIIEFLHLLKHEKEIAHLEEYYNIIFSEMKNNRYAIIIDNIQSYSPEILEFLKKMLQFLGAHIQSGESFALILSLNTSIVYDTEFLDFAVSFQTASGSYKDACFECADVKGFVKEEQAIAYLQTLLCLDEYPLNYNYLKKILLKTSLKPKYIELIAGRMLQEECIHINNNIGIITDKVKFKNVLEQIPPKYEDAFVSNFKALLSVHSSLEKEIEDVLSYVYFFDILSNEMIDLFKLNRMAVSLLCKHNILQENSYAPQPTYIFEHDLVEMTISKVIYPDILERAITLVMSNSHLYHTILQSQYQQFALCELFSNQISIEKILDIWNKRETLQISNKFTYKFYLYFIKNLIRLQKDLSDKDFMTLVIDCCKYVRDHVSEVDAEHIFEISYPHLDNIVITSKEMASLYYSFIIHLGENKIRLVKSKECLAVYHTYYDKLRKLKETNPDWSKECQYAEAYINNRIFVCGKISGNPRQYLSNWAASVRTSKRSQFWDIQFENYFDLANIYLNKQSEKAKLLYNLKKGFFYYNKLSSSLKQKYSVNYLSKRILYLLLERKYDDSLNMIEVALNELENNSFINYHIFFREKYIKYKIINLMLIEDTTNRLDKSMEEYEQLLKLTGHLEKNLDWIFLQAKYALALNHTVIFDDLFESYYIIISQIQKPNLNKDYYMLEELAIKFRQLHETCSYIMERNADLTHINHILKMDNNAFQNFYLTYQSTAPLKKTNNKEGFYL